MYVGLTLKLVADRPTDIVMYRAAIAAKNESCNYIYKRPFKGPKKSETHF